MPWAKQEYSLPALSMVVAYLENSEYIESEKKKCYIKCGQGLGSGHYGFDLREDLRGHEPVWGRAPSHAGITRQTVLPLWLLFCPSPESVPPPEVLRWQDTSTDFQTPHGATLPENHFLKNR